jgi:2-iminobutanoate/2-iminopropanoate deaminase
MPKTVLRPEGLPPSSDPYSQIVEAGGLVFLAGQVGSAPGVPGRVPGDFEAEARATFENVGRLLAAVELGFGDVVRCTVYLVDFADFATMNALFREYFPIDPPVRATVAVVALARDYRIEIEATAAR